MTGFNSTSSPGGNFISFKSRLFYSFPKKKKKPKWRNLVLGFYLNSGIMQPCGWVGRWASGLGLGFSVLVTVWLPLECCSSWSSVTSGKGLWGSVLGSWAHFPFLPGPPTSLELRWVGSWCCPSGTLECLAAQRIQAGISSAPLPPWVQGTLRASPGSPQERAQESLCSRIPEWHGAL